MAARNRLPPWHEELRLRNGLDVLVRPIRPEDAPVLSAGFELLEPRETARHLLRGARSVDADDTSHLAQPDARTTFTLVVAERLPPGEAMISALGHATIAADAREARFTLLVGRNVAGMGLGRHLLRRVVRWARGKRLAAVHGDVPEGNGPLMDLALSMGFGVVEGADPGFVRVRLPLAAATPVVVGADGPPG